MAKESLEVIDSGEEEISVVYQHPKFYKRLLAQIIDLVLFFLTAICCFIGTSKITEQTTVYKKADATISEYREASGMFLYSSKRKTWENVVTYYDNNADQSSEFIVNKTIEAINKFLAYIKNAEENESLPEEKRVASGSYLTLVKDYNEARLSSKMVYKNEAGNEFALFIETTPEGTDELDRVIIKNPDCKASSKYYLDKFYREYALVNCGGFMLQSIKPYAKAFKTTSNLLFFEELPIAVVLASFFTYLFPTFFWRRGRRTVGKTLFHIGYVDSRCLNPTFWRYLAKWAIFFFGEVVLSFFTFGVPLIISFTMMAFSKKKQPFSSYMLGLTEIDMDEAKIYFDMYEVRLDHIKDHKDESLDFKMVDRM